MDISNGLTAGSRNLSQCRWIRSHSVLLALLLASSLYGANLISSLFIAIDRLETCPTTDMADVTG